VRTKDSPRRHSGKEVGDLDAVQHVGIEDDDKSRHDELGLLVESDVLGFRCHCVQGTVRLRIELISIGQDVEQPQDLSCVARGREAASRFSGRQRAQNVPLVVVGVVRVHPGNVEHVLLTSLWVDEDHSTLVRHGHGFGPVRRRSTK